MYAIIHITSDGSVPAYQVGNALLVISNLYKKLAYIDDVFDNIRNTNEKNKDAIKLQLSELTELTLSDNNYFKVESSHELILDAVELHSPGFWEFLGKINPLETIRIWLNDEHERKKDISYRNNHEKTMLFFEEEIKRLELFEKQIKLVKNFGISESEARELIANIITREFKQLDSIKDLGIFKEAQIEKNKDSLKQ